MTGLSSWHVFVGTEVGLLKGVNTAKGTFANLNSVEGLAKDDEITSMCWEDALEKKILTGHKNQVVKTFDCETQLFSAPRHLNVGDGAIKGLCCYNSDIVTAVESGIVKLWKKDEEENIEINTRGNLCKMTPNPFVDYQIATGGEENDLQLWNLSNPASPLFRAKNVKNDFLDLRVPVWIMDMKFKTANEVITCTRHHQIRLYDTRVKRRPVIDMEFERYPLMSLSLSHNENQVVVGSSRGRLALVDLRRKLLVHVFKGFAGSIRNVNCHPTLPLVASCGLDRFLRIHDLNKHKLLKKIYLKTRLNSLLLRTDLTDPIENSQIKPIKAKKVEIVNEDDEKLWNSMPVVKDTSKLKRTAIDNNRQLLKKKLKSEV